ncbi:hypothetical protein BZG04_15865 [Salinivibrio kushneri]|uniref:hypothetical protein n=1 Tax=Salinivibrio kushneri TaxID=1908198 RepID=UPI000988E9D3|nr:hypothetical protein [Salinivibrio kushneri]OOE31999.1 hypothetical protein BZG04_15865 [Salinivibrio kushneri]
MSQENESSILRVELATSRALDKIEKLVKEAEDNQASSTKMIENAKSELIQHVIDKSVAPVNRAVTLISVVLAFLAIAGTALSFTIKDNLETTLTSQITKQVETWLSFDSDNSKITDVLENYRERALLDAYMIKLAREASTGSGVSMLEFKAADKSRLLDIVTNPSSSYPDFHDALTLLAESRGVFGLGQGNDRVAKTLREFFSSVDYDDEKKLRLLEVLENDIAMLPVAEKFLKNEKSPYRFKLQAFKILSQRDSGTYYGNIAKNYALSVLKTGSNEQGLKLAADYIAKNEPLSPDITSYIERLDTLKRSQSISLRLSLIDSLLENIPSESNSAFFEHKLPEPFFIDQVRSLIGDQLLKAIKEGARFEVSGHDREKYLVIAFDAGKHGYVSQYLDNISKILDDEAIWTYMLDNAKTLDIRKNTVLNALITKYKGDLVIGMEISAPLKIISGLESKVIDDGKILLNENSNNRLTAKITLISSDNNPLPLKVDTLDFKSSNLEIYYDTRYIAYRSPFNKFIF